MARSHRLFIGWLTVHGLSGRSCRGIQYLRSTTDVADGAAARCVRRGPSDQTLCFDAGMTNLITDTKALAQFCERQKGAPFVAVDTEFMRERTYWPILCLVQVAGPEEAVA